MGGSSRYDRHRPVRDEEAEEARAFHTLGELLRPRPALELSLAVRSRMAFVLHAAAIELDAGRPIPLGVRNAIRAMADAVRASLDPRTGPTPTATEQSAVAPPRFSSPDSRP